MAGRCRSFPEDLTWGLNLWDVARLAALRGAGSADDILTAIVAAFETAIRSGSLRVGWEQARKNPLDHRVVLQFHVGSELFDRFFNARTGYRAHFRFAPECGTAFNARLIQSVSESVSANLPETIAARELDSYFTDQRRVLIERASVESSLVRDLSKAWFCSGRIEPAGGVNDIIVSVTGPRIIVGFDESFAAIEADEDMAWLDIKGAFLSSGGPYQIKPPDERAQELHKSGTA
jgi:hypothetical protein